MKTLEELIGSCSEATLARLKASLLQLTKTKREYRLIDLLCQGYTRQDTADFLCISIKSIYQMLRAYRLRLTVQDIDDLFAIVRESSTEVKLFEEDE